ESGLASATMNSPLSPSEDYEDDAEHRGMTILDRYILKHFFLNFVILFTVLFLFSCVADLFVNLDRFVDAAREVERMELRDAAQAEADAENAAADAEPGTIQSLDAEMNPDGAWANADRAAAAIGSGVPREVESSAGETLPNLTTDDASIEEIQDQAAAGGEPIDAMSGEFQDEIDDDDQSAMAGTGSDARTLQDRLNRLQRVAWMVFDFYWPRAFQFYAFLFGVVVIGATGFTLVQFHRNRELTAVLAAGVSLHRVALPFIFAALALNVLQFANRELVLPKLAPQLLRDHGELGQRQLEGFRVELVPDSAGRVFYAAEYLPDETTMHNVVIWEIDDTAFTLTRRIEAEKAIWQGDGWVLENGRVFQVSRDVQRNLDRHGEIDFITSDLDPETLLLRRYQQFRQMLSLEQIAELSQRESMFSDDQVALFERVRFGRFAQFMVNMLAFLIALPFFLVREPRNMLLQAVGCASVSLSAQIGGAICTVVGLPGLPPAASVFIFPLLILLPLAAAMMSNVKT
ncbi:MAG: LptF/LptG family permease, partial [Planctomycetota bacterium]